MPKTSSMYTVEIGKDYVLVETLVEAKKIAKEASKNNPTKDVWIVLGKIRDKYYRW